MRASFGSVFTATQERVGSFVHCVYDDDDDDDDDDDNEVSGVGDRILKDVVVTEGFVGCIESVQINSSQTTVNFDLADDSSHNVLHKVNIGQFIRNSSRL